MAAGKVITGFSKPYVAVYSASGGTVTYSKGMELARGVGVSTDYEVGDSNPFYANNVEAENVPGVFTGGTATLTVDGLFAEAEELIFGLPEPESFEYGADKTVQVRNYGEAAVPPYVGIGFIIRYMSGGVTTYAPYVLTKSRFQMSGNEANTQEESIEWQTRELTADLMRDDTPQKNFQKIFDDQETETEAEEILQAFFKITGGGA